MRNILAFLCCFGLTAGDIAQLRELADNHRLFDLRRALEQPGWNGAEILFYRALVACRFGNETEGIGLFQKILGTSPSPEIARKAHEEMAAAFDRLGHYKEAAQAEAEALLLTPKDDPERPGSENTQVLMASLSEVASMTAEFGEDVSIKGTRNRLGSWDVPVQVNGAEGHWIFDTGANISTLTESEAKRMGLSVLETKAYVTGSTEKKNNLRLAVARDLRFGPALLHNSVFLVLADQALYVGPLHYQITGILGLPVLRALRRVEISNGGLLRLHPRETLREGTPNLFFDDASPIVETEHNHHRLQMFLDTGANATELFPSSRVALTGEEISSLKTKRDKTAGAGGMISRKIELLPVFGIQFLGTSVNLRNVTLLSEPQTRSNRYRDGVIGMDALWGGFLLDFDAMRVEVH